MKHLSTLATAALSLLIIGGAASLLVQGCATTSSEQAAILAAAQLAVTEGASIGTSEALASNPSWRPDFTLAAQELSTLSSGTNEVTSASIEGVLAKAGETNSTITTLVVAGLSAADGYLAEVKTSNSNSIYLEFIGWVATGITEGENSSTAALKSKYHAR